MRIQTERRRVSMRIVLLTGMLGVLATLIVVGALLAPSPSARATPNSFVAVSAGGRHTCALTAAGGVRCWGDNFFGQLGDGTTTERHTPVDVTGLTSGVAAVSAGARHTCAVTTASGLKCWGRNLFGQLGDGTTTERHTPVDVTGLTSGVAAVSAGGLHTCAVTTAGGLKCWGRNITGPVGDGTTTDRHERVDVGSLGTKVTT